MFNGFAPSEPGKNARNLIWTIWRGKERDRLADDLVGRIAIHPLGPTIPTSNDALEGLADDSLFGGIHNGG